jgi:sec-independent protein translocase protein TatC
LIIIPYIFYQIVEFVKPTIKIKFLLYLPFFSTLLFLAGMITGYFMAVFTTEFMSQMAAGIGVVNMWTISSYLNLLIITSLMFGIVFQMPLLMLLLTKTGIIPLKFFKGMRPWVIFIMLCTIAIISPQGDVVSLIVMSMPVIIMYELGIFVSSRVANHRLEEA